MTLIKQMISGSILLLSLGAQAADLTAFEVIEKADQRDDGASSIGESTMILIDKKDRQRVRQLKMYSKDYPDDYGENTKAISFFLSPADVKGTGYLTYAHDDISVDDESWLYLPALQKVNRIAAGDKSGAFMGSDFTYADMNGINIDWYDYEFINEEAEVNGQAAWHISSTPKADMEKQAIKETGYTHSEMWILKENFIQTKAKIWLKKGKKVKYFQASEIELIDGIWTPKKLQMITTKKGKKEHVSILQINNIRYNQEVSDNLFTTDTMKRGE
jgi:hypothetical protein